MIPRRHWQSESIAEPLRHRHTDEQAQLRPNTRVWAEKIDEPMIVDARGPWWDRIRERWVVTILTVDLLRYTTVALNTITIMEE